MTAGCRSPTATLPLTPVTLVAEERTSKGSALHRVRQLTRPDTPHYIGCTKEGGCR